MLTVFNRPSSPNRIPSTQAKLSETQIHEAVWLRNEGRFYLEI